MVTQREIALRARVSQMTVSLALNDSPSIPDVTRQRIKAVARDLAYRPDPMLSVLMRQRRRKVASAPRAKIAFLHSNPEDSSAWVSRHYATACFKGARERATQLGYIFEAVYIDPKNMPGKRLSQILWTQNVQGLIIAPMPVGTTLDYDWDLFAAVGLDYSLASLNIHRVIDDHMAAMARLVSHLAERHYCRPGLVMREACDDRTNHNRLGSFLAHCARSPSMTATPPFLFNSESWDEAELLRWVRNHQPDVVVAGDPLVLAALERNGISVPKELGVALYYKHQQLQEIYSGLSIDPEQVGGIAAQVLISMIENNQRGLPAIPTTTYVDMTKWEAGSTLRPAPPQLAHLAPA